MKNSLTFRSKDFLFCITGIWEELAQQATVPTDTATQNLPMYGQIFV